MRDRDNYLAREERRRNTLTTNTTGELSELNPAQDAGVGPSRQRRVARRRGTEEEEIHDEGAGKDSDEEDEGRDDE